LVQKSLGKWKLGTARRTLKDNIKIKYEDVNQMELVQDCVQPK
jgi:hypothetical protein